MEILTNSKEFITLLHFIEERCGIFLGGEKSYILESKLKRMLADSRFKSFETLFLKIVHSNDTEIIDEVIDAITVNETFWFRDKTPWIILEEILLPKFINEFHEGKRESVEIWSGACSTGQEPYSIAMCIDRYLEYKGIKDITLDKFHILSTDISQSAIKTAEAGRYDNISIQRGLDEMYLYKYFKSDGKFWCINEHIKSAVRFKQFNLVKEYFSYNKFDVIFLRNVLIYFSDEQKLAMMRKVKDSLKPEGVLFIGSSEIIMDEDSDFSVERLGNGTYYKNFL